MSDREKRCNAMGRRLAAAPIETWGDLFVVFHEEGFSAGEIGQAIESNVYAGMLCFFRYIQPRAIRAAACAEMLKSIGDALQEHEDIKGGHDA